MEKEYQEKVEYVASKIFLGEVCENFLLDEKIDRVFAEDVFKVLIQKIRKQHLLEMRKLNGQLKFLFRQEEQFKATCKFEYLSKIRQLKLVKCEKLDAIIKEQKMLDDVYSLDRQHLEFLLKQYRTSMNYSRNVTIMYMYLFFQYQSFLYSEEIEKKGALLDVEKMYQEQFLGPVLKYSKK